MFALLSFNTLESVIVPVTQAEEYPLPVILCIMYGAEVHTESGGMEDVFWDAYNRCMD